MTFELFRDSYKPHIRSDGYDKEVAQSFTMDGRFFEEFRYLRRYLLADSNNWGDDILLHLSRNNALPASFSREDGKLLSRLYKDHAQIFRTGKFAEDYLQSIEQIALLFIYHDIRTIWILGGYREQTRRLIDLICERGKLNTRIPIRDTMHALTGALTIEMNQIQRCYTLYERFVSKSLVEDLQRFGMLTGSAQGIQPAAPPRSAPSAA